MSETPNKSASDERLQQKVALVVGVLVVLLAIWSLYSLYRPPDGARDFTRIGGGSRVETSIEAARFWSKLDRIVVAPGWADDTAMLKAGVQAARLDAPLLLVGEKFSKNMRQELKRWTDQPNPKRFCSFGFSPASSILKAFKEEVKQKELNPCPEAADDETVTASMSPVHVVAPDRAFLPTEIPNELRSRIAASGECDLRSKLRELTEKWWGKESERASNLRCTLPDTVVFATAQNHPELPDVAVAIALAAHLKGSSSTDQERSSSTNQSEPSGVDQAVVVILPRYLESSRSLETFLHERGTKVARGVVIGGEDAVTNDLNKQLRSVMALTNIGAIVQGSSTLIDKLGVVIGLLLALGILGVGAGAVAAAATGTAAPQIRRLIEERTGRVSGPPPGPSVPTPSATPVPTGPTNGEREPEVPKAPPPSPEADTWTARDAMAFLHSVVDKYRGQEVWIRLRLSNPDMWVAGTLDDTLGGGPSPFPKSQPLWLTNIVQCDTETGELRFAKEGREPLRRADAIAVRWENVQLVEVISREIVNATRSDSASVQRGFEGG